MINLGFEPNVLLLAELELEIDDLFLFAQVRDHRPQFGQFGVHIVARFSFASGRCCGCIGCLLNAGGLRAHGLKMLMEN
jgi:hypothetical protein